MRQCPACHSSDLESTARGPVGLAATRDVATICALYPLGKRQVIGLQGQLKRLKKEQPAWAFASAARSRRASFEASALEDFRVEVYCDACGERITDADALYVWDAREAWNDGGADFNTVHARCFEALLRRRYTRADAPHVRTGTLADLFESLSRPGSS